MRTAGTKQSGEVVFRPLRVRVLAWIGAIALFGVMLVVAVLLPATPTGVHFRLADQVAMALIGLLMALGVLLLAMPKVSADAERIHVRNVLVTKTLDWREILAISFPDGASWARLELPDYEYLPVLAVQAVDRDRAVAALRTLRELHHAATSARESGESG